jgi:ubiquinone/menaquinone biosynthesis C-methylase UbiE
MQALVLILQILGWAVLVSLGCFVFLQTFIRLLRHFVHFPSPPFVPYLINNPIRRKLWPPERVIDYMDIKEGMIILEVGPGTGFYTFEAARRAGTWGHVYAVDIEPKVMAVLDQRIEEAGVKNITTKIASAYEIPLPSNSVDRALMVAVLPEIPDKQRALREIHRILKKEGLLTLAELLIDPDYPFRKTEINGVEAQLLSWWETMAVSSSTRSHSDR